MISMFYNCSNLTSLDLSGFNTEEVTSMISMFYNCSNLTSLDLSGFKTDNVTDMFFMFWGCSGLTSLDVSGFNTVNVTIMSSMFNGCSGLTSLDVSGFNTENVTAMPYMFIDCTNLTTIYCNDSWICSNCYSMFGNCTSLVGAISYDDSKTDVTYANPTTGYFTLKGLIPMEDKEEVTFGEDGSINENTDLNGNVIDNVFFNIDSNSGGYDADEKCVVVSKPMTDEEIETVFGKDIFSDEVRDNFAGMIIEVPAGKGKVAVEAQTTGFMTLKVKIGAADPVEMELEGKLKMKFPYNVTEPTYVYIYAGESSNSASVRTRGEIPSILRIYGISVESEAMKSGDVNGDGKANVADIVEALNLIKAGTYKKEADLNNDGKVDSSDVDAIAKVIISAK